jgi:GAF domain-containing protein
MIRSLHPRFVSTAGSLVKTSRAASFDIASVHNAHAQGLTPRRVREASVRLSAIVRGDLSAVSRDGSASQHIARQRTRLKPVLVYTHDRLAPVASLHYDSPMSIIQHSVILEQLRGLIGNRVHWEGADCEIIEVLEDGPLLIVQHVEEHTVIQTDQYGEAHRRVPSTHTIPILTPDQRDFHPAFVQLGLFRDY